MDTSSDKNIAQWTKGVETVLIEQRNKCAAYKWMHEKECRKLIKYNKWLNVISIIIISVSATGTTITNNLGGVSATDKYAFFEIVNFIYPILLYFTAVVSSLQQLLNYEKEAEKHRTASIKYTALYNSIKRMLSLSSEQRQPVQIYFSWATREYDSIFSSSPEIQNHTIKYFEEKFNTDFSLFIKDQDMFIHEFSDHYYENEPGSKTEIQTCEIPIKTTQSGARSLRRHHGDIEMVEPSPVAPKVYTVTESENLKYELDRYMTHNYL